MFFPETEQEGSFEKVLTKIYIRGGGSNKYLTNS